MLVIILLGVLCIMGSVTIILTKNAKNNVYEARLMGQIKSRKMTFYEQFIKRFIDIICAWVVIIFFSPLYIVIAVLVHIKLGSPVLFSQERPGLVTSNGKETVFTIYKFRTMTDECDENGKLLSDEVRLTKFGQWLRKTSLDELPEVFNILNGTMSVIGPRPQLVRDMVFMNDEQRMRHTAKPGLSGLAQVNGRNAISWEEKIAWDLEYIDDVSFLRDIKIVIQTVRKALLSQEGISQEKMSTSEDFGDYLLRTMKINDSEYKNYRKKAQNIMDRELN